MNTLLGFIPRILGLVSDGLGAAQDGVNAVSDLSKVNPKKSGVIGLLLGYLGVDPTMLHTVGAIMSKLSGWLLAF